MSDRFDAELKKALKDSTARSLEGWEFTPAMRQTVLKRIAEEEGPADPVPARRSRPVPTRPLMWMAAAAAAFVVAFNMMQLDLGFGGGAAKQSEAPMSGAARSTASKPAAPVAKESPSAEHAVVSTPGTKGEEKSGQGANTAATTESSSTLKVAAADQAKETESAAMAAPASPARLHLVVPEATASDEVGIALKAPGGQSPGIMAVGPEVLGMARTGANAAVRTRETLQLVDGDGGLIWEKSLAGGPGPVVTLNGKIATSAGSDLYRFNTEGRQELRVTLHAAPEGIFLSPDDRIAALVGDQLLVYEQGKLRFRVNGLGAGFAAFGPDGSLAVTGKEGFRLFSRDGALLWTAPPPGNGLGITFAGGGEVVVADGQAFHRSGQPLWRAPIRTQGVFTLGADGPVVLWDSKSLTLVRPEDGTEIWTAAHGGRQTLQVASSDSGDQVAVLASVDEGAAVWVLNRAGGQRYAEKLPSQPLGVAVEGDTLLLLTENGVESRALPPR
ncbi:MAG: PQQ-binding-like beta-propeller repeat protein [Bacillota bacterium]